MPKRQTTRIHNCPQITVKYLSPNREHTIRYHQKNSNDYATYSIWTDGSFTLNDDPIRGAHHVKRATYGFRHTYTDGNLVAKVNCATWLVITEYTPGRDGEERVSHTIISSTRGKTRTALISDLTAKLSV